MRGKMFEGKRIGALLLMGGEGKRFGSAIPKQFCRLGKKRVYEYALETLLNMQIFDEILLVCHSDWIHSVAQNLPPTVRIISGGSTRQQSSFLGLKGFLTPPDIVLIHDAVRPLVSTQILQKNVELALEKGAVDTCIPSADTLVHVPDQTSIAHIPPREQYLRGQTPQTFCYDWVLRAHEKAEQEGIQNATDDCRLLLSLGFPIQVVWGEEKNLKITTEWDLKIAELFLTQDERVPSSKSY